MKKALCLVFVVSFMLSLMAIPSSALENTSIQAEMISDSSVKEMVQSKSIQAFPEYENKIRGNQLSANILGTNNQATSEIVISETRFLSENEAVHYTEYNNGVVLTSLFTWAGRKVYESTDGGTYTVHRLNAWLNCAGSTDLLMIYGVVCRDNNDGSNSIQNVGYIEEVQTSVDSAMEGECKRNSDSSGSAYVDYSGYFTIEIGTGGEPMIFEQFGLLRIYGDASVEAY